MSKQQIPEESSEQIQTSNYLKDTLLTLVIQPDKQSINKKSEGLGPWLQISNQLTNKRKKATEREQPKTYKKYEKQYTIVEPKISISQLQKYESRELENPIEMQVNVWSHNSKGEKLNKFLRNIFKKNKSIQISRKNKTETPRPRHEKKTLQSYYQTLQFKKEQFSTGNITQKFCPQVVKQPLSVRPKSQQKIESHPQKIKYLPKNLGQRSILGFGSESCTTRRCLLSARSSSSSYRRKDVKLYF